MSLNEQDSKEELEEDLKEDIKDIEKEDSKEDLKDVINEIIVQKSVLEVKKKKPTDDNCRELKNIAYKTMLLNGTEIVPEINNTNKSTLSNYLENESNANQKETWTKLDKTQKIKKLTSYIDILQKNNTLNKEESNKCKNYLVKCLDRKALNKTKDVNYDKDNGTITNIPNLHFENSTRVFILKKDDKHVSTVKCLPSDKKSKGKTIKIHE